MKYRLLRPALRELQEAAKFYENRAPGLGFEFQIEIRATIRRILGNPRGWASLDREIRRCRTRRFPYAIIYTVDREDILIISVMHLRRHPDSWRRNLP